ncbi:MAG: phage terminase large subunit [Fimbriimonadaceae bacterium]|nr:phage terminase large subunit [Fimbriimonadaceae bacterium]
MGTQKKAKSKAGTVIEAKINNPASAAERVSEIRREIARGSLRAFALTYLAHHFKLAPSKMHEELFPMLEQIASERGSSVAVAAPRGHAKSTVVTLAYVLWLAATEREKFIMIISDTAEQAKDHLKNVKNELEDNERLRADYPEVCEVAGRKPGPDRWRSDDLIARNNVRITAAGAEQKLRGRKHGENRPTLIICDDLENEEIVKSPEQRAKRADWFKGTVLKAGTEKTNVIAVGTLLHSLSLLSELTDPVKSPGWWGRKYQAVQAWSPRSDLWDKWENIYCRREECGGKAGPEGARLFLAANSDAMLAETSVLWPEGEGYERLMELRQRDGRASFDKEKQNAPYTSEDCFFLPTDIQYWDGPGSNFQTVEQLLGSLRSPRTFGACDPSMGKLGKHNDFTAIITIARDANRTDTLYVIDAEIRKLKPDAIIDMILQMHTIRHYSKFGIEEVQYQEYLKTELQRRAAALRSPPTIKGIRPTADKAGRIQSLQALIATGMLKFSRRHATLLEQLLQFPHADHDDGPDALQMAVEMARARSGTILCHSDGRLVTREELNRGIW